MALYQRLLRTFYRTGLPYLAVAGTQATPGEEIRIQAFLSRALLDRLMTDLERARSAADRIPADLLVAAPLPDELLPAVRKAGGIPVLSEAGDQVAFWDEASLLRAVASLRVPRVESASPEEKAAAAAESSAARAAAPQRWLAEMVLQALPMAMLATDLGGRALFYNERFERVILSKDRLRKSMRLAEEYFLELTRRLLARSFELDPERKFSRHLNAAIGELGVFVRIFNLEHEGRVQGYLYMFQEAGDGGVREELIARLEQGEGLETLIDEIEAVAIHSALESHGHNISHAAQSLGIKRSTLQNKMKRLNIEERFGPRAAGPIRRLRRSSQRSSAESAVLPDEAESASAAKASALTAPGAAARASESKKESKNRKSARGSSVPGGRKAATKKRVAKAAPRTAKKSGARRAPRR